MATFSSARSAYIRFSLAFSASSSRNRVTSETLAPPYLLRHLKTGRHRGGHAPTRPPPAPRSHAQMQAAKLA